jgi:hypothetical protein
LFILYTHHKLVVSRQDLSIQAFPTQKCDAYVLASTGVKLSSNERPADIGNNNERKKQS